MRTLLFTHIIDNTDQVAYAESLLLDVVLVGWVQQLRSQRKTILKLLFWKDEIVREDDAAVSQIGSIQSMQVLRGYTG